MKTSFIAFRIPFLVIMLSVFLAGALGYVTTLKLAKEYEAVEAEGSNTALTGVLPLITTMAEEKDCNGIKSALNALVNGSMVVSAEVDINSLDFACKQKSGAASPAGAHKSLPIYDADNVRIGEIGIVYSLAELHEKHLAEFYTFFGITTGVYFLLLLIVLQSLVNALRPLHMISREMDAFNPESPSETLFEKMGSDEVALLSRSAGKMFDNLVDFARRIHASNTSAINSESHLKEAQRMAKIGSWEYSFENETFGMSMEMYRILCMNTKNENITWEQFLAFVADEDRDYVDQVIDDAVEHGSKFHMGYQLKTANGDLIDVHTYGKVRKKADGKVRITGVTRDVTEQNRTQQMIEKLAYFDVLTNLPNRALFKDRLNKAIETAKRSQGKVGVLFLDLDHFKLINDTLGHHIGDRLLVFVAETLNKQLRGSDTIARIGGDEFVVLLPQVKDESDAVLVAEKLLEALEGQHIIERHTLFVSTSIGIAVYPDHAEEIGELIKHADTAMYEAKQKGRNNWQVYKEEMGGQQYGQLLLEEELYISVKNKEQFEVYYQPQFDAKSKEVCGLEALLRWHHPEQGLLESDQLIPLMESSGLIVEMGEWVIDRAAAQIAKWSAEGKRPLPIAINLSARQLQDSGLVEHISTTIESYAIDAHWLGFEVSEGILVSNVEMHTSLFQRLKKIGVFLALDDYGSSFSSIPMLTEFPLDLLKVDQRFIADVLDEPSEAKNIAAMLAVGRTLGFKTVVEGIEEREQEAVVLPMECDVLQGYLYSKPVSIGALELFLKEYIAERA
jgi:diguanylate cyclase (GGDEF)-like protein